MDLLKSEESPSQPRASVFASLHRKPHPNPSSGADRAAEKAPETRDEAIKSAKRYLLETIRDDWSYEYQSATPTPKSELKHVCMPLQPQSSIQCDTSDGGVQVHAREVREWREREQDSSCSESGGGVGLFAGIGSGPFNLLSASPRMRDPYRFESPGAVQESVLERKRKRRKVVEEEAAWNEGLRIWIERRDAWTGARLPKAAAGSQRNGSIMGATGSSEASGAGSCTNEESEDVEMASMEPTEQGGASSQPLSSSSSRDMQIANARISSPPDSLGNMGINGAASPINTYNNVNFSPNHPRVPDSEEPLIPVVKPLLPITNPVRASIKPSIYPSIYSKVVIQSLTPAIPINLSDVTKALVQGWKADGEWPPKSTVAQGVPVKKRFGGNKPPPTEDTGKSRRLSGSSVTGAVKKVLGLSGINTGRRFHIRGGSHGGAGTGAGAGSPTASGVASNEVAEAH
ncbi:hypothetical protein EMPG_17870 [Blastomyces silverae]|uniref:Gag1-like clamp domain-containing protein n=1 Tax=Blastomyces silverae TaxID=2060906 RepID=A0A0H1BBK9_9EURO|nr:hypothetical protein EMPG_17870 [Blastomyces silverae]